MGEKFYAGGFFFNPRTQQVLLHKRDGNTEINPHKWTFFGGSSEGEETPTQTFVREIEEELGVKLSENQLVPLDAYINEREHMWRHVFYIVSDMPKSQMTLGEGADFDWVSLEKVFEYDLSDRTAQDLNTFLKYI